jgi:hypothetical protein
MRGHTRCRSHRDRELGRRGGGAPPGNLNALKSGRHAHPVSLPALELLAGQIVDQPDLLPDHIAAIVRSIQDRTRDPHKTLLAFRAALPDLTSLVAKDLFVVEANALLRQAPPSRRDSLLRVIKRNARGQEPGAALRTLRTLAPELERGHRVTGPAGDRDRQSWLQEHPE